MGAPNLSVIVPNYNNFRFLSQCIDSILSQTYRDLEIIISDDCSQDESNKLINRYERSYPFVKTMFNKKTLGVAQNKRKAIRASKGKYITILDSDDFYYSEKKLEKEMDLIDYYKTSKNIDIVAYSNFILVDSCGSAIRISGKMPHPKAGNILSDILTRSTAIPRNPIMLKKDYCQVGGFASAFKLYEDWDLKIRLSAVSRFHNTQIVGNAYRIHAEGLSSAPEYKHMYWMIRTIVKNRIYIAKTSPAQFLRFVYIFFIKKLYHLIRASFAKKTD